MIGVPLAVTAAMVFVVTIFQVFFGAILATLWFSFGAIATVTALITVNTKRRWFVRDRKVTLGRLFLIVISTWVAAWIIATIGYSCVALILTPGASASYLTGVLASAALGIAPFLFVYALTSAIQLTQHSRFSARGRGTE
jgi:hypothetical protein